jgi:hypothetical protein
MTATAGAGENIRVVLRVRPMNETEKTRGDRRIVQIMEDRWRVMQLCMYVCVSMYVCMYVCACMYVCMYMTAARLMSWYVKNVVYVCLHVCCVCMYVCMLHM